MEQHYTNTLTADPESTMQDNIAALQQLIQRVKSQSPFWSKTLSDFNPNDISDLLDFSKLPILNKSELIDIQQAARPYGELLDPRKTPVSRVYYSPGPLVEPVPGPGDDPWRVAPALKSNGFGPGDIVANCFSYHITPAGYLAECAATKLGCTVFPAGVGNVETILQAINYLGVNSYIGTPDFLRIIMEKAEMLGQPIKSLNKATVSGGPLFPELRQWYTDHQVRVRQAYITADLGLIAYETDGTTEGMLVADDCLVEIVRPGTNKPVKDGEVGEVVVTTFSETFPLVRYATGDLSAYIPDSEDKQVFGKRIKGWLGRADQTTKVRGMFVHPRQVASVINRFTMIGKARVEVSANDGRDQLTFFCESSDHSNALAKRIEDVIRAECRLRGDVIFVAPQSLPNDGKIIDDKRAMGA
ncbi:MAG: phenylacetate--CoA ligase family protein [Arenicella sp.]